MSDQKKQRQQLVKRLRKIARTNTVAPFFTGAMCYIIMPPSPVQTALYGILSRLGKTSSPQTNFFKYCTSEKYQEVFALLQESGFHVSYSENEEHKGILLFHFPGVNDIILEPIPDVSTLEMMVRFLENDTSVTIEDIENRLENLE